MNSGIYVIQFDNGIKIGQSFDLSKRIKVYDSPWCRTIKYQKQFSCHNQQDVEREVLNHFSFYKTNKSSEFITNVSLHEVLQKVEEVIKKYLVKTPITEGKKPILKFIFEHKNGVFSTKEMALIANVSTPSCSRTLNNLCTKNLLTRVTNGVYVNTNHFQYSPLKVIPYLLDREHGYISFLTALHLHGIIEQIPQTIHVATTGHGRKLHSPVGTFEFFQIQPSMHHGISNQNDIIMATPEKALLDTLYVSSRKKNRFNGFPELDLSNIDSDVFKSLTINQVKCKLIQTFIVNKFEIISKL